MRDSNPASLHQKLVLRSPVSHNYPPALRSQYLRGWRRSGAPQMRQFMRQSALSAEIQSRTHTLSDGVRLEVLSAEVPEPRHPTLLFVHGVGHGAWCWQERFLPYFQAKGFPCHALSLRAQGGSEKPEGIQSGGSLAAHADDVSDFLQTCTEPPVLIGHSFGGLVIQSYIVRDYEQRQKVCGIALLASAPPKGRDEMVKRTARKSPANAERLQEIFKTKSYLKDPAVAKFLFFSDDLPDDETVRYFELLRENWSEVPAVDVASFGHEMPLPPPPRHSPPVLVLGGDADQSVDVEGLRETAAHYGTEPIILPRLAHDLMLADHFAQDTRWESAAVELEKWITSLR